MSDITHTEDRVATNAHVGPQGNGHASSHGTANESPQGEFDQTMQQIRDALRGLRFGNVSIIVQDGVVIQIDRTEKRRVRRSSR